jgi:hypothetical protein
MHRLDVSTRHPRSAANRDHSFLYTHFDWIPMTLHPSTRLKRTSVLLFLLAIVCALPSCFIQATEQAPVYQRGTFELSWSIDGQSDPVYCRTTGSASVATDVFDSAGSLVGRYGSDCASLGSSIELDPGLYSASATLLDAGDRARTTTVQIAPFSVRSSTRLQVFIDFPANAFF